MFRGRHLDSSILVGLVTNLVVYEIEIMAGGHSTSGSCYCKWKIKEAIV